jgi:hypothetical protein
MTALYLHLGPFSRHVIGQIEQRLDQLQNCAAPVSASAELTDVAIMT